MVNLVLSKLHRFLLSGLVCIAILLLAGRVSNADEIASYSNAERDSAKQLLDHDFLLPKNKASCLLSAFCFGIRTSEGLEELRKSNPVLIYPTISTDSSMKFLAFLKAHTACSDLGILSIVLMVGTAESDDPEDRQYDFFRPTHHFALYEFPYPNKETVLLSAEDYVNSASSAPDLSGVDTGIEPEDIGKYNNQISPPLQQGAMIPIDIKNCKRNRAVFYFTKSVEFKKNDNATYNDRNWFAAPIAYEHQIYLINAWLNEADPNILNDFDFYAVTIQSLFPRQKQDLTSFYTNQN